MDRATLDKLKVADLKKLLKERGLKVTGTKSELIDMLLAADEGAEEPTEDDSILNEEPADDSDVPNITAGSMLSTDEPNELPLDASLEEHQLSDGDSSLKKIQSVQKPVAVASDSIGIKAPSEHVNPLEARKQRFGSESADTKKLARAERFGLASGTSTGDIEKAKVRAERFGIVSAPKLLEENSAEKLKKRAGKFGVASAAAPVSKEVNTDKLQNRAARFGTNTVVGETKSNGNGTVEALKKRAERFGVITSATLNSVTDQERILKRKERFVGATSDVDSEAKKLKRQEKFASGS